MAVDGCLVYGVHGEQRLLDLEGSVGTKHTIPRDGGGATWKQVVEPVVAVASS